MLIFLDKHCRQKACLDTIISYSLHFTIYYTWINEQVVIQAKNRLNLKKMPKKESPSSFIKIWQSLGLAFQLNWLREHVLHKMRFFSESGQLE